VSTKPILNFGDSKRNSLHDLEYVLIPGHFKPGFEGASIYNELYTYWRNFWSRTLSDNKSHDHLNPYEFMKSDIIAALVSNNRIAGMFLHSLINFEQINHNDHPYLANARGELFTEFMTKNNFRYALTMEFLSVSEEWRKSVTGVSLGAVLIGLSCHLQNQLETQACFGRGREDIGVDRILKGYGGCVLQTKVDMHNTPVSFVAIPEQATYEFSDPNVNSLVSSLWERRKDLTQNQPTIINGRRAA
jgi:hypothetical protein